MQTTDTAVPPARRLGLVVSPHAWLGDRGMLGAAVFQVLAGLALSGAGIRFDGALDVHRTWQGEPVPWHVAVLDQVASWPIAVVAAWLVLRVWRTPVGLGPLAWTIGLARVALVLIAPLVLAVPTPGELTATLQAPMISPPASVVVTGLAVLVGFLWFLALLTNGLRRLTGARGARLAGIVIGVLVAAEVASKLVVSLAG
jgi:hypothetical protein